MDKLISIPFRKRFIAVRIALRQLKHTFAARLLHIDPGTYDALERGTLEPNLSTIRKLRILEERYADEIAEYHKACKKHHTLYPWGRETKVYEKYGGRKYTLEAIGYKSKKL